MPFSLHTLPTLLAQADRAVFGELDPPQGVEQFNNEAGGVGIVLFASNMLRLASLIAGLWVFFNFIRAGYIYITGDSSNAAQEVSSLLTNSVVGILIIVGSFLFAGLIGLLFFGDALFIIEPTLYGPDGTAL
jgi:hypothetical protein